MTMAPLTHLGDLAVAEFIADYWQQKPVCIRNGIAFEEALIAMDELAGLALEPEVESRLIENKGDIKDWQVTHGPLKEVDFNKYSFGVICVEHNFVSPLREQIQDLMNTHNYVFHGNHHSDDWFIHTSL